MLRFLMRGILWRAIGKLFGGRVARNARTTQKAVRLARRLGR